MTLFRKPALTVALSGAIIASASIAGSHAAKSDNADVAARHDMMMLVGHNMGILGASAKGEIAFNAGLVTAAATSLNALAKVDPATLWTGGTEQGAAQHSRAKASIWSDPDGFAKGFDQMATASAALMQVTDIDGLRAGMGALGGSCKDCHQGYRGPKNE